MEEVFKSIEGFENYQVSNQGRVISNTHSKSKFLTPQKDSLGYLHVRLYPTDNRFGSYGEGRGKRPKLYKVHRLVLETFFPEGVTEERNEVNHINGDKTDNRLQNLQWVSRSENLIHAYDIGLKTEGAIEAGKKKWKPVKTIDQDGFTDYYLSRTHAALAYNTSNIVIICAIKKGVPVKRGKAKGVTFFDCKELPKGEKWSEIADVELKLLQYREKYYGMKKREYRREYYKKNKARKNNK